MTNLLWLSLVAAVGGLAVTVQAHLMGLMEQKAGTLESVFVTYAGGGLLICLPILLARGGRLAGLSGLPWYAYTTGACGLVIVGSIAYTVPRLGLVTAFTILVAAQFILGAVFDHYGLLGAAVRPIDLTRLLGMAVLLLGVWLIIR